MKKKIASFRDLDIYRKSYDAAIVVIRKIIPKLPREEKYDLANQPRPSTKAIPRLIAEGYSRRRQVREIYGIEEDVCNSMVNEYEIISRQTYKLAGVWTSFGRRKQKDE